MTRFLPGAALAAFACFGGARAETVFVGDAAVLSTTPQCGSAILVGEAARLTYRPAGPGLGNGVDSYLSYVGNRSSFAMTTPGKAFRAGVDYAGQALSASLSLKTVTDAVAGWEQRPAELSRDTPALQLTATLGGFWAITGCRVTMRAHLVRVRTGEGAGLD